MAHSKCRHDWNLQSSMLAMTANCHRDPKERKQPYTPADFNPMVESKPQRDGVRICKANRSALRALFGGNKK